MKRRRLQTITAPRQTFKTHFGAGTAPPRETTFHILPVLKLASPKACPSCSLPVRSIVDNMFVGRELRKPRIMGTVLRQLNKAGMRQISKETLSKLGLMTGALPSSRTGLAS